MLVSCLALWKWSTSPAYFLGKFCPLKAQGGGGTPLEDFSVARIFDLVLNLNMIHRLKPRPARILNIISRVANSFWEKDVNQSRRCRWESSLHQRTVPAKTHFLGQFAKTFPPKNVPTWNINCVAVDTISTLLGRDEHMYLNWRIFVTKWFDTADIEECIFPTMKHELVPSRSLHLRQICARK